MTDTAKLIAQARAIASERKPNAHLVYVAPELMDALADALEAAQAELHPTTEEGLGRLIATVRAQVELDEGGYCVLCRMHYTDQETLAHDRMRADAAESTAEAAEARSLEWVDPGIAWKKRAKAPEAQRDTLWKAAMALYERVEMDESVGVCLSSRVEVLNLGVALAGSDDE